MNKETYLKKFSRAVHWRLPREEADEVLADYNEIFSQSYRESEEIPVKELGEPVQAARLLSVPKTYGRWLAVFGMMAVCLLLPAFLLLRANFSRYPGVLIYILFLSGSAASLIWFRPQHGEHSKSSLPKTLLLMLLGLLVFVAAIVVILAGLLMKVWEFIPPELYGRVAHGTLLLAGAFAAIFGLFGLVKARLSDRRWRSLYVMGLTVLAECVLVLALLVSPTLGASSCTWLYPYIDNLGIIGIAGLLGAGVSLC